MSFYNVRPVGDSSLVVEFESRLDSEINERVIAVAEAIRCLDLDSICDVVPTFYSVTIYFNPLRMDVEQLASAVKHLVDELPASLKREGRTIRIPVVYGGEYGPDLKEICKFGDCTIEEAIKLHTEKNYRVYMLGFIPGFPYLGRVNSRIAMPRKSIPRLKVQAGSVGIAGLQTGIYPLEVPGGWQIIGRTPVKLFDIQSEEPTLFKSGDTVVFESISKRDFLRLNGLEP